MPAAAIPALISAGGTIGGALIGNRTAKSTAKAASQRSPEELRILNQAMDSAGGLQRDGAALAGQAMPGLHRALGYYGTLLNGNRSEMQQATAPEAGRINSLYRGYARNLQRRGINGGEARTALAESERERVGNLAGLVGGARGNAAQMMGTLGTNILGQGNAMRAQGGGMYANLLNNSSYNRQQGFEQGQKTGASTASSIAGLATGIARDVSASRSGGAGGGGNGQVYEPNDQNGWG
jgi:hypothetical protein